MTDIMKSIWGELNPFASYPVAGAEADMQGWGSNHRYLTETVNVIRPSVIVEIGVWKGGSAINMAKECRRLGLDTKIICVDTWLGAWDHWVTPEWFNSLNFQDGYPTLYKTFMNNVSLSGLQDYIVPLPIDSLNAVEILSRKGISANIVHIDGGHDYHAVLSDLKAWWPLVQEGGALIGDD